MTTGARPRASTTTRRPRRPRRRSARQRRGPTRATSPRAHGDVPRAARRLALKAEARATCHERAGRQVAPSDRAAARIVRLESVSAPVARAVERPEERKRLVSVRIVFRAVAHTRHFRGAWLGSETQVPARDVHLTKNLERNRFGLVERAPRAMCERAGHRAPARTETEARAGAPLDRERAAAREEHGAFHERTNDGPHPPRVVHGF